MIKCLECGAEETRLQWTHFKYKCSGRFNNGKEYMKAYPGAKIVSPDVAKKTAVTIENLILKYGEEEGNKRWQEYREKQAYSNSFEYKKARHGWDEKTFSEFNSSRAQTIDKMIERYGEADGVKKWQEYCDQQSYTKSKQYFVDRYGENEGTKKFVEINKKKTQNISPFTLAKKLNIDIEQAADFILNHKSYSTVASFIEIEFVKQLETILGKLEHTSCSNPYGHYVPALESYVVFDIRHKDCIIEFNGDYWHANPALYKEDAKIRDKTASSIWQRDKIKLESANEKGFRTMVVWESDYRKNRNKIINEVIEWILNESQSAK
jgi:hypothetical protein